MASEQAFEVAASPRASLPTPIEVKAVMATRVSSLIVMVGTLDPLRRAG